MTYKMNYHQDENFPLKFLHETEKIKLLVKKKFSVTENNREIGNFRVIKVLLKKGEIFIQNIETNEIHALEFMNRKKGGKGFFWACQATTKKELEKLRNSYPHELKLELLGDLLEIEKILLSKKIIPPFRPRQKIEINFELIRAVLLAKLLMRENEEKRKLAELKRKRQYEERKKKRKKHCRNIILKEKKSNIII